MPNKKPAPKKAAKPAKKSVPAKKPAAKPVKKVAPKPAAKPAKKAAAKPAPKKAVKPAAKPAKKVVAKPVKKAAPAKKPAPKPVKKAAPKPVAKKVAAKPVHKPAPAAKKPVHHAKPEPVKKAPAPVHKPISKKPEKQEPLKEVKLPKITAKKAVPYTPDYKPMGQRPEAQKENAPLVRYTDSELNEFRDLINKKLDAAKRELSYLQGLITRKDDMGGDESENRYMTMEDGSISMEREQLSQMASRQITYIDHLEKALIRIENKTYGICRVTGKLIDKARLRAVPHATLSLEAKLGLVKPNQE